MGRSRKARTPLGGVPVRPTACFVAARRRVERWTLATAPLIVAAERENLDLDALERLARLRQDGMLTESEYHAQKQQLLKRPQMSNSSAAGLRPRVWVVALVVATAAVAAFAVFVLSRNGQSAPMAVPQKEAAAQESAVAPSVGVQANRTVSTDENPSSLVGTWAPVDGCSDGAAVTLATDGQYVSSDGGGRWSLRGRQLHMTNWGGSPAVVRARSRDRLELTWSYGSEVWQRCSASSATQPRAEARRAASSVPSADAEPRASGRCRLVVLGTTYMDGACRVSMETDGSFQIMALDESYFAYVFRDGPEAEGHWNETPGSTHAHTSLGTLRRRGACWENDRASVCAWQ
jgi:hypothetical protein